MVLWRPPMPLPGLVGGRAGGAALPEVLAAAVCVPEAALPLCDWAAVTTHALPWISCLQGSHVELRSCPATNCIALSSTNTSRSLPV